ncbi:hypothetical protein K3495_g1230 [Podosphaera aphanis]|nr:hypothetical protein K3495_g1230 [Podosphaera aphanis]
MTLISSKEASDRELAIMLRREGRIKTAGEPFDASQKLEIDGLTGRSVIKWDPEIYKGVGNFNSRIVNEVKGRETGTPHEKSSLVIHTHNVEGKEIILTQSRVPVND